MSTKIIEVTGTQPLVTVDDNVSNVEVVNQPIEVTVQSAVAVGNTTIRNAFGAIDPIYYDKINGLFGFIDRSEVVRSEKMVDAAATPDYAGEFTGVVELDAENFDIFPIRIAGPITEFNFGNIASGQTVTIICEQSTTPGYIDDDPPGSWSNWFWTNNNNTFPSTTGDVFIIKVLWTGNTYYASLMEFDTVMPETQVGIPVGPDEPENPEPGWLWYDTINSLLMIYVDGAWVVAGGGGGANVSVGDESPSPAEEGDLWFDTGQTPPTLKVYYDGVWYNSEGLQGPRGYTGSQGIQGALGYTGSAGRAGYTGSQGIQGDKGYTGSASTQAGPTGSQGPRGYTGSKGDRGFTGSASTVAGPQGYTGSQGETGFTGSRGDAGFTGSASTQPGPVGFTGSQGTTGFTGSQGLTGSSGFTGSQGDQGATGFTGSIGFTGSAGFTGSTGLTGSQGPAGADGTGVIDEDAPDDGQQYARVRQPLAAEGTWELVEATGGGGDWDGVLFDKPAVIQQPTGLPNFNQTTSGITIGKNGFDTNGSVIPVEANQYDNLVVGARSYIKGINNDTGQHYKNVTAIGSNLPIGGGWNVRDNSVVLGNAASQNIYLGGIGSILDESVNKFDSDIDLMVISPVLSDRSLAITSEGSVVIANKFDPADPDQMLQFNATRVRHRSSLDPETGDVAFPNSIRRELYYDPVNIFSAREQADDINTEDHELIYTDSTWRNPRQINYFSPERLRLRKFTECVNYQEPGDNTIPDLPDQSYATATMNIDLHRGTIQHKILTDNVINIFISDQEYTDGSAFRSIGYEPHDIDPGTSITIILYHQDALRTITWPASFKFLGGESELSTEASTLPDQIINRVTISNIQAIDMLHAFYDGQTWWASITRGYE